MNSLLHTIRGLDSLAATHELYAAGFGREQLRSAVARGDIQRVRQGWYSTPDLHPLLSQAACVGGRLGCVSGAALHGLWLPPSEGLHVVVEHNDCRLRTAKNMRQRLTEHPSGVTAHWHRDRMAGSRLLLDPIACLEDVIRCQPPDYAVAIADSALRRPSLWKPALITPAQWGKLIDGMPGRSRQLALALALADGVCESGTESIARFRLAKYGLPLRPQVWIGRKRVDFLIGRRLVVEIDGAEYHIDPERFEADRTRDAELTAINYIVLRFSYNQVIHRWREVEAAILAAVAHGDHL
jgi:very-short-patch-repair endonuclease